MISNPLYERLGKNNLRITPYYFEYQTFAKERWIGRKLTDVFTSEFGSKPKSYFVQHIASGKLLVNDLPVDTEYIIRNNDLISHKTHRHEPNVVATPIQVIYCDEDMIVVDKPFSIPVHPTGSYNHMSLTAILNHRFGLAHLSLINRIDRLVSGIVMIALSPASAARLHEAMSMQSFIKEYICIVHGRFEREQTCEEPIAILDHKRCIYGVSKDGKPSKTFFKGIKSFGEYSLVYCRPFTGRSHQIRVHLSHMGYPILNDPLYSPFATDVGHDSTTEIVESEENPPKKCAECGCLELDSDLEMKPIYLHAFRYSQDATKSFESSPPNWGSFARNITNAEFLPRWWFK